MSQIQNASLSGASTKIWNRRFTCLFIANSLLYLGQYMVQTLITQYVNTLGAQPATLGFVASAFALTALIFKVFAGPAADTFRRDRVLRCAMLVMAIAYFGFSISTTVPLVIAFRLLQGVGMAFCTTCCLALASDSLPQDKISTGIGMFTLGQAASQSISPAIGLWIADRSSFNVTFAFAAAMALVAVLMTLTVRGEQPSKNKKFHISLDNIIAKEAILPAVLMVLLMSCFCLVNSYLVIYATEWEIENIGYYFTLYAATLLISRPLMGRLSDQIGFIRVIVPSLLCFAISFYIISYATSLPIFLLAAVVAAFGFGGAYPVIHSLCMKSVPSERRGAAGNTSYIGFDLGNLIGPSVAAIVISAYGYVVMWRIMPVLIVVAVIVILVFRKKIQSIEDAFLEQQKAA